MGLLARAWEVRRHGFSKRVLNGAFGWRTPSNGGGSFIGRPQPPVLSSNPARSLMLVAEALCGSSSSLMGGRVTGHLALGVGWGWSDEAVQRPVSALPALEFNTEGLKDGMAGGVGSGWGGEPDSKDVKVAREAEMVGKGFRPKVVLQVRGGE